VFAALAAAIFKAPAYVVVSVLGLGLDIIGVWWLAEGLLVSDEDARYRGSWDHLGHSPLLIMRDRRQGLTGMAVAIFGFFGQIGGLLLSLASAQPT